MKSKIILFISIMIAISSIALSKADAQSPALETLVLTPPKNLYHALAYYQSNYVFTSPNRVDGYRPAGISYSPYGIEDGGEDHILIMAYNNQTFALGSIDIIGAYNGEDTSIIFNYNSDNSYFTGYFTLTSSIETYNFDQTNLLSVDISDDDGSVAINNLTVSPITPFPEPSTWVLLLAGMGGAGAIINQAKVKMALKPGKRTV